jgi:hypothetical protein
MARATRRRDSACTGNTPLTQHLSLNLGVALRHCSLSSTCHVLLPDSLPNNQSNVLGLSQSIAIQRWQQRRAILITLPVRHYRTSLNPPFTHPYFSCLSSRGVFAAPSTSDMMIVPHDAGSRSSRLCSYCYSSRPRLFCGLSSSAVGLGDASKRLS